MSNYIIRPLEVNDYRKGYFELLNQLSPAPKVSFRDFIIFHNYKLPLGGNQRIFVIEDDTPKLIGHITVFIEDKLTRNGSHAGHIEDVVVDQNSRGKGVARALINYAVDFCRQKKCYKILLNCDQELCPFYQKMGFKQQGVEMRFNC